MFKEYLVYSISGINILSTILLIIIFFYWILSLLGIISSSDIDIDFGLDDFDLDIDGDGIYDINTHNPFVKILSFGNFGVVPFMFYMTIYIAYLWTLTMLTFYIKLNPSSFIAIIIFLINFIISFFLTKYTIVPLIPFFQGLEENIEFNPLGKIGILTTDLQINRLGTIKILGEKGREVILNVMSKEINYKKGDKVLILEKIENRDVYLVATIK
ncbi:MAG: hypothetical protein JW924_07300 [Fusobacteriaceae bacterium]|nr:hypothetical protein [Fusobacteriaceae bacterium]